MKELCPTAKSRCKTLEDVVMLGSLCDDSPNNWVDKTWLSVLDVRPRAQNDDHCEEHCEDHW